MAVTDLQIRAFDRELPAVPEYLAERSFCVKRW
jgi:hypothetical protein